MITACIVLLYLSYAIPVACLLIRGRSSIRPGPFWLGPLGLFANIVLLMWTLFTLIMYSFPYAKPVEAGNMNCEPSPSPHVLSLHHNGNHV
jgi:choline transport protein